MTIKTEFILMAQFNDAYAPLDVVCEQYLKMDYRRACRLANAQKLPFPVIRPGSQKGPWMVHISDLAKYLDALREEAHQRWRDAS